MTRQAFTRNFPLTQENLALITDKIGDIADFARIFPPATGEFVSKLRIMLVKERIFTRIFLFAAGKSGSNYG